MGMFQIYLHIFCDNPRNLPFNDSDLSLLFFFCKCNKKKLAISHELNALTVGTENTDTLLYKTMIYVQRVFH